MLCYLVYPMFVLNKEINRKVAKGAKEEQRKRRDKYLEEKKNGEGWVKGAGLAEWRVGNRKKSAQIKNRMYFLRAWHLVRDDRFRRKNV